MPAYRVLLFQSASEQGYSVSCPALPGCWSQEETRREALANIRAAIGEYLQAARTVRSV
ncbi:MAG: type II toxin-antitoxin system HicB family antitoxin [Terracidiphilus sp.]